MSAKPWTQSDSEQGLRSLFRAVRDEYPPPAALAAKLTKVLAGHRCPAPVGPTALGECLLREGLSRLRAASGTFYVRDPWWPDEYRLLYMPGVRIREPMHGFLFPAGARDAICGGEARKYQQYHPGDDRGRREAPPPRLGAEERLLFEGFARREGLRGSARLLHHDGDGVAAVLFVNFTDGPVEFTAGVRRQLDELLGELVPLLPAITAELLQINPLPAAQIIRILRPVQQLATLGPRQSLMPLRECLGSILEAALAAFDIRSDTGLGTIHLFERKTQTLRLAAFTRGIDNLDDAWVQSVAEGDGVISWVAREQRAILIDDLESSPFRRVHRRIRAGARSELAVPLLADDQLLGVANLECDRPAAFPSNAVRILWYAASQAAIACHLYQYADGQREHAVLTKQLLRLCLEASVAPDGDRSPLDELARVACDALQADICHVWRYNEAAGRFEPVSSTESAFEAGSQPRRDGWSEYIRQAKKPVWIANVQGRDRFDAFFWDPARAVWDPCPPAAGTPETVNQHLAPRLVLCELGIPILLRNECTGIAWLKYLASIPPPSPEAMFQASGLAGEAVLVRYKNGEGQALVPSPRIMSLADEFTQRAAAVMSQRQGFCR